MARPKKKPEPEDPQTNTLCSDVCAAKQVKRKIANPDVPPTTKPKTAVATEPVDPSPETNPWSPTPKHGGMPPSFTQTPEKAKVREVKAASALPECGEGEEKTSRKDIPVLDLAHMSEDKALYNKLYFRIKQAPQEVKDKWA